MTKPRRFFGLLCAHEWVDIKPPVPVGADGELVMVDDSLTLVDGAQCIILRRGATPLPIAWAIYQRCIHCGTPRKVTL